MKRATVSTLEVGKYRQYEDPGYIEGQSFSTNRTIR